METKNEVSMTEIKDYRVTFWVDKIPKEVFEAIAKVRGWFTQAIDGDTDGLGAVFYYHYQDNHRCTFKITEFVPGKKNCLARVAKLLQIYQRLDRVDGY